jgi:hypothetical protein
MIGCVQFFSKTLTEIQGVFGIKFRVEMVEMVEVFSLSFLSKELRDTYCVHNVCDLNFKI